MGHKEVPVTQLRKMLLEELQRRNYSQPTVNSYLKIVESFAKHFGRSPDQLGPEQIRTYAGTDTHLSGIPAEEEEARRSHRRSLYGSAAVFLL